MPRDMAQFLDQDTLLAVFRNTSDGVLIIDRRRKAMAINPSAEEITGWTSRDLSMLSCPVFNCQNEQNQRTCEESCLCLRAQQSSQIIGPMFLRLSKATGGYVDVESTFVPVLSADGRSAVTAMVLRDITQLEEFDEQVQELNDELAEKGMVLQGVSDALASAWKIPLVNIRTAATHLRSRYGATLDEGARYLQRVNNSVQELETLFAKVQAQARAGLQRRKHREPGQS